MNFQKPLKKWRWRLRQNYVLLQRNKNINSIFSQPYLWIRHLCMHTRCHCILAFEHFRFSFSFQASASRTACTNTKKNIQSQFPLFRLTRCTHIFNFVMFYFNFVFFYFFRFLRFLFHYFIFVVTYLGFPTH